MTIIEPRIGPNTVTDKAKIKRKYEQTRCFSRKRKNKCRGKQEASKTNANVDRTIKQVAR